MTARWKQFRSYSGLVVRGAGEPLEPPSTALVDGSPGEQHVARAFWLTAKVETGAKFGACVAYDGTAMTAGLDQHIAVYPRELAYEDYDAKDDQGGLWKLLRRMEVISNVHYNVLLERLFGLLRDRGWYLAQDGVLRYIEDQDVFRRRLEGRSFVREVVAGMPVFGFQIRDALTPVDGKVPKTGARRDTAEEWMQAFSLVFAHDATYRAQVDFGMEHLV